MAVPSGGAEPGSRLAGRYRLDERIGAGGMGEVWRATDELLGRTVAVKTVLPVLLSEPGFDRRFFVEAQAMAGVSHPGVVAIHDYHSDASGAFLVMQFVQGESLSGVLRQAGRLTPRTTMEVIAQAADALHAVHAQGIVHRDVKPANLLVRPDGTVMLTDFGIARRPAGTALTSVGAILGTPSYLAPEQVLGETATPRSDVYALGLVAYECLSGQRPFEGENPYAVAMQRLRQPPRTVAINAPRSVLAVIEHAMATDPAHRLPSAADMAAAARAAMRDCAPEGGSAPTGHPAPAAPHPRPSPEPEPWSGPRAGHARPQHGSHGYDPAVRFGPEPGWVPPGNRPVTPAAWRRRHVRVLVAAVVLALVAGGGVAWFAFGGTRSGGTPTVGTGGSLSTVSARPAASTGTGMQGVPFGFDSCDGGFCPTTSMCWGGLVIISGVASVPEQVGCDRSHYWQTFLVAYLPTAAIKVPQGQLMYRQDVASICSTSQLAKHSRDPSKTKGWQREPLPMRLDDGTWLLHCLTSPKSGESVGSVT